MAHCGSWLDFWEFSINYTKWPEVPFMQKSKILINPTLLSPNLCNMIAGYDFLYRNMTRNFHLFRKIHDPNYSVLALLHI